MAAAGGCSGGSKGAPPEARGPPPACADIVDAAAGGRPVPLERVHLATVDSTNSWVKRGVATLRRDAVTVVTADEQTAGRGRVDRVWKSSAADIKATYAFVVPRARLPAAYQLSPLLAVAAVRACAAIGVAAAIKWPNDLIVGGSKKVGGILCELESHGGVYFAVLGIGINVNSLPPDFGLLRPVWPLSTLRAEAGGAEVDRAALMAALTREFTAVRTFFGGGGVGWRRAVRNPPQAPTPHVQAALAYLRAGWEPFQREYEAASVLLGRRVRFSEGSRVVEGRVSAIGGDGKLYIELPGGETVGFLSGEVAGLELVAGSAEFVAGHPDGK